MAAQFASHFKITFYAIETRLPAALAFSRFAFVGIVRDPLHAIARGQGQAIWIAWRPPTRFAIEGVRGALGELEEER